MQNIHLPNFSPVSAPIQAPPTGRDVFPINLMNDIDFGMLAGSMSNFIIPARTTIYVLPPSRDRSLLQIDTGDKPARAFSVIRHLQSILRAPLSPRVYHTQIQPDIQDSVRQYFLLQSGPIGTRLWQGFLDGFEHPEGPKGAVLLQGHSHMWGFTRDQSGQWFIHVDEPFSPLLDPVADAFSTDILGGRAVGAPREMNRGSFFP
ncbi:hypothetical protein MVEN_01092200 [Mycena venus]|uniref:Uncharacterized protein n=1 Tax=Mycena venus TaxID=2733690 RepID=A0A8H6Y6A0_9AGAR|nr:hypothetical protein MVEN_01092200 [Mycena venus]